MRQFRTFQDLAYCSKFIASATHLRYKDAHCGEHDRKIGIGANIASVVKADDGARAELTEDMSNDPFDRPFPIMADDGPHTTQQAELTLGGAQTKPAHAIGCAKEHRQDAGIAADRKLRLLELVKDLVLGKQVELPA